MARIIGVEVPPNKRIDIALRYIYGIGPTTAGKVLDRIATERKVVDVLRRFAVLDGGLPSLVGQAQPRCHLPRQSVTYPCCLSRAGSVSRSSSISGASQGPRTFSFSRVRQQYRPVKSP